MHLHWEADECCHHRLESVLAAGALRLVRVVPMTMWHLCCLELSR